MKNEEVWKTWRLCQKVHTDTYCMSFIMWRYPDKYGQDEVDFAIKNIEAKASLRQNTTVVHTAEICGMFMRVSRCFEMFRDVESNLVLIGWYCWGLTQMDHHEELKALLDQACTWKTTRRSSRGVYVVSTESLPNNRYLPNKGDSGMPRYTKALDQREHLASLARSLLKQTHSKERLAALRE